MPDVLSSDHRRSARHASALHSKIVAPPIFGGSALSKTTLASALVAALSGLSYTSSAYAENKPLIGISMPTNATARWVLDAETLQNAFAAKGYAVDLRYADNDEALQAAQVGAMAAEGAQALVVTPVGGASLSAVLERAEEDVLIVAYDRLIRDSAHVDYYATSDKLEVGVLMADSLIEGLKARFPEVRPWSVEIFGGSPDDYNAVLFHAGALSKLQPLIDSGAIVVRSGQIGMERVATPGWSVAAARARLEGLLSEAYADGGDLHGVLSPFDGFSRAFIEVLREEGAGAEGRPWPIITGQDADPASVKAIIAGEQYSTVFKDTPELARMTAELVDLALRGEAPTDLDVTTFHNGAKLAPTLLLTPDSVDLTNYERILMIETQFVTPEDLR